MQRDIAIYAQLLNEDIEQKKKYEKACKEFEDSDKYEDIDNALEEASIDDILGNWQKKKDAEDEAAKNASEEDAYVKEIDITDVHIEGAKICKITYDLIWSDGKTDTDNKSEFDVTDPQFAKAKRQVRAKSDQSAAVALLQSAYSSVATKQIVWMLYDKTNGVKKELKPEVTRHKQLKMKLDMTVDPAKAKAYEIAKGLERQFGNSHVHYTVR